MANELSRRLGAFGASVTLLVSCVLGLVLFVLTVVGLGVVVVSVGVPILMVCFPLLRAFADTHRKWAGRRLGTTIPSNYRPRSQRNALARLWETAKDPATWRDLLWLLVNSTVGLALYLVGVVESVLGLLFWWLPRGMCLGLMARITKLMLAPSEKAVLKNRVRQLAQSRAEAVDSQAAEIRRIERDLHDGAQARLVALGMNLGMAEQAVDTDPESAKLLLAEARAASSQALAELRGLVRGIHPPVLADRGLVGAVEALALASPLTTEVTADLPGRLPAPVESAAYFGVAEALTNVIKHSGAQHARICLTHAGGRLSMTVADDGRGGAVVGAGTGLRGIERRLSAFDGTLSLTSPPGGPTVVTMELPCESSSPKILPSSGTA